MVDRGDSEVQARLRDHLIKEGTSVYNTPYIRKIRLELKPGMILLDIGCGTGHIIQELAAGENLIVGLDISEAMLQVAVTNTMHVPNINIVQGDGRLLPFSDCSLDVVITRLAEYSLPEAYRITKKGGYFFEYGLGPEADREIKEFFPDRIDEESFFFPKTQDWKKEIIERVEDVGFVVYSVQEYREEEYYQSKKEVMDLIEMVPLVRNFDREKDRRIIDDLAEKYSEGEAIEITWHYYILEGQRL
jgi:SAM-dependent methyltransferase